MGRLGGPCSTRREVTIALLPGRPSCACRNPFSEVQLEAQDLVQAARDVRLAQQQQQQAPRGGGGAGAAQEVGRSRSGKGRARARQGAAPRGGSGDAGQVRVDQELSERLAWVRCSSVLLPPDTSDEQGGGSSRGSGTDSEEEQQEEEEQDVLCVLPGGCVNTSVWLLLRALLAPHDEVRRHVDAGAGVDALLPPLTPSSSAQAEGGEVARGEQVLRERFSHSVPCCASGDIGGSAAWPDLSRPVARRVVWDCGGLGKEQQGQGATVLRCPCCHADGGADDAVDDGQRRWPWSGAMRVALQQAVLARLERYTAGGPGGEGGGPPGKRARPGAGNPGAAPPQGGPTCARHKQLLVPRAEAALEALERDRAELRAGGAHAAAERAALTLRVGEQHMLLSLLT